MKNLIGIFLIILTTFNLYGQKIKLNSKVSIVEKQSFKFDTVNRKVIIDKRNIIITNFLNGSKQTERLRINRIVKKKWDAELCTWYYCTSKVWDFVTGFTKVIVIVPKERDVVDVFVFADEVSVYNYQILIEN